MREYASGKNRTELYLRALKSLRELLDAQGEDAVSRAYAEVVAETCYQLFADKGFKRSDGRLCVQRLLGKQCNLKDCVPPSGDHDTLWLQNGKPARYVTQPYGLEWETMRKLVAFCENYGLKANVDAWPSFHFPGRVLSIHLSPQERQGQ
ncbi:MAG: hypothetical protein HY549_09615 [Elusimicrobia bacterium]|nr:hypothetical protein [Elusimicrobiota bacterium]